ncbi:MAG TPA: ATP-binding protein [Vicinamibacterales bacterium]|nr:ATP-binding protein [Vicinamibacterales bacterium]
MRLSIRAKQIAGVTAIVGLTVVALSGLYLARLADLIVTESQARAQVLASTILHRVAQLTIDPLDKYAALRTDGGLRSILEASVYDKAVTSAAIVDPEGTIVMHREPSFVGEPAPEVGDLTALAAAPPLERLQVIYSGDGKRLETRVQMKSGDQNFGSIRVGVSTLLMRSALTDALYSAVVTAALALLIAVFVAGLLSRVMLRPIHVIRSGLTRLGRGEFGVTLDLPPGDEFSELGNFFNTVSQQLSADRSQLADQKANLESLVEHLEDAVALFNPAGELLFTNPAMQSTFSAGNIGRPVSALVPAGHAYRTLVEETLATRRSRGPVQFGDDLAIAHAITGAGGELVGILLVVRNLAYVSRMQSTIAYSRKLVALGRLTAGIAHEVKNPLNAMMIHLELMRMKIRKGALVPAGGGGELLAEAGRADEGLLQHVGVIETEIRRLDEVVQGFLKFTRPEDLRLQAVRVRALFDEVLPILGPEAQKNDVRVVVETPDDQLAVNGDSAMLRQAIMNLAMNAFQAMPTGGTLRLIGAPAAKKRVELRIEDTGVGIPPEHLDRIFDLYFTTKDHGTGIGLSMVYRIVQMHDGEVEVQSTPGRGTTFRLLLPRAE